MRTNLILASLLAVVGYFLRESRLAKTETTAIHNLINHQLNINNAKTQEATDVMVMEFKRMLRDDAKAKYRFLTVLVEDVRADLLHLDQEIDQLLIQYEAKNGGGDNVSEEVLFAMLERQIFILTLMPSKLKIHLSENHEILGMTEDQMTKFIDAAAKEIEELEANRIIEALNESSSPATRFILLKSLKSAWVNIDHIFAQTILSVVGGRRIDCGFGPPYIMYPIKAEKYDNTNYQYTEMFIFLHKYYLEQDNFVLKFILNDQEYYTDDYGVIHLEDIDLNERSQYNYQLINTLTNEVVHESTW